MQYAQNTCPVVVFFFKISLQAPPREISFSWLSTQFLVIATALRWHSWSNGWWPSVAYDLSSCKISNGCYDWETGLGFQRAFPRCSMYGVPKNLGHFVGKMLVNINHTWSICVTDHLLMVAFQHTIRKSVLNRHQFPKTFLSGVGFDRGSFIEWNHIWTMINHSEPGTLWLSLLTTRQNDHLPLAVKHFL